MNKQIVSSLLYFMAGVTVLGLFYMVIYPNIIPIKYFTPWTLTKTIETSFLLTVMFTYGDYRYREGIRKAEDTKE